MSVLKIAKRKHTAVELALLIICRLHCYASPSTSKAKTDLCRNNSNSVKCSSIVFIGEVIRIFQIRTTTKVLLNSFHSHVFVQFCSLNMKTWKHLVQNFLQLKSCNKEEKPYNGLSQTSRIC